MTFRGCIIYWLWTALLLLAQPVHSEDGSYTFGVVPQQTAKKTAELWLPVLSWIQQYSGIHLILHSRPSIPEFESALAQGEYDFAYMNPYHYVHFNARAGYQALAQARNRQLVGIVIARRDSAIESLADLEGQVVAFPAPAAFAASVVTRSALHQQGITFTPEYVNTHDSVYLHVYNGGYVAGGGVMRTLENMDQQYRDGLKVVWTSESYPPHAIANSPTVPAFIVDKVRTALINMEQDEQGRELLAKLNVPGWQVANDVDWDIVRALDLHLLEP